MIPSWHASLNRAKDALEDMVDGGIECQGRDTQISGVIAWIDQAILQAESSEKEDQLEAQPGSEASAKANPAGRGSLPAASTNPQFDKDYRPCTCHHDDAPVPCPRKYALTECLKESAKYWQAQAAKLAADVSELTAQLDAKPSSTVAPDWKAVAEDVAHWINELCVGYLRSDQQHKIADLVRSHYKPRPEFVSSATLEKDAARYRWLRDGEQGQAFITAREERGRLVADADVDLDRYVDEYIERARK